MIFRLALFIISALSILCFILMYVDKRRAIDGKFRISESCLFSISLAGGAIGCLASMYVFRHKTKKVSFKILIPLFSLTHVALLVFLFLRG